MARSGPLPSNRRLWRASSTLERSGLFNIWSHHFDTRYIIPFFFVFMYVGHVMHPTTGNWHRLEEDNGELPGLFYDKLNSRRIPLTKNWLRPG